MSVTSIMLNKLDMSFFSLLGMLRRLNERLSGDARQTFAYLTFSMLLHGLI